MKRSLPYKITAWWTILFFVSSMITPLPRAESQLVPGLPLPGSQVLLTTPYTPAMLRGITVFPDNPLQFDFLIDAGDDRLTGTALEGESLKLVKYFLASLTTPEDSVWVNLSPKDADRVIADGFGQTQMGQDLLAQDYLLKQLTASLMAPDHALGKAFWDRVHARVYKEFGTTAIPADMFHRIWIVPDSAQIYVNGHSAYVVESHLKVMLEKDYRAQEYISGQRSEVSGQRSVVSDQPRDTKYEPALSEVEGIRDTNDHGSTMSDVVREVLIPAIEEEVNSGATFTNLRQIYNAMILATWYKRTLKSGLLSESYVNQNKVKGVTGGDPDTAAKIYNQYMSAFKKGVYDMIKEDYDPVHQTIIPRKYFSGGVELTGDYTQATAPYALLAYLSTRPVETLRAYLDPVKRQPPDRAEVRRQEAQPEARQEALSEISDQKLKDSIRAWLIKDTPLDGVVTRLDVLENKPGELTITFYAKKYGKANLSLKYEGQVISALVFDESDFRSKYNRVLFALALRWLKGAWGMTEVKNLYLEQPAVSFFEGFLAQLTNRNYAAYDIDNRLGVNALLSIDLTKINFDRQYPFTRYVNSDAYVQNRARERKKQSPLSFDDRSEITRLSDIEEGDELMEKATRRRGVVYGMPTRVMNGVKEPVVTIMWKEDNDADNFTLDELREHFTFTKRKNPVDVGNVAARQDAKDALKKAFQPQRKPAVIRVSDRQPFAIMIAFDWNGVIARETGYYNKAWAALKAMIVGQEDNVDVQKLTKKERTAGTVFLNQTRGVEYGKRFDILREQAKEVHGEEVELKTDEEYLEIFWDLIYQQAKRDFGGTFEGWLVEAAATFLKEIKKQFPDIALYVISANENGKIGDLVERTGLRGLFDDVYGQPLRTKDGEAIIDKTAVLKTLKEQFRLEDTDVVFFGDSPSDIKYGRRSGVYTIGVANTYDEGVKLIDTGADAIITSFEPVKEITKLLLQGDESGNLDDSWPEEEQEDGEGEAGDPDNPPDRSEVNGREPAKEHERLDVYWKEDLKSHWLDADRFFKQYLYYLKENMFSEQGSDVFRKFAGRFYFVQLPERMKEAGEGTVIGDYLRRQSVQMTSTLKAQEVSNLAFYADRLAVEGNVILPRAAMNDSSAASNKDQEGFVAGILGRVHALRQEREESQIQFTSQAGVHSHFFASREITIDALIKIANYTKTPLVNFFGDEEKEDIFYDYDVDAFHAHFGHNLRMARIMAGLTLRELAEKVGIGFGFINDYEMGHNVPYTVTFFKLCNVLGVSPDQFARENILLMSKIETKNNAEQMDLLPAPEALDTKAIGRRIGLLTTLKGVSQADVAKAIGMTQISPIVRGDRDTIPVPTLAKMANYFGVSVFYLLTGYETQDLEFQLFDAQHIQQRIQSLLKKKEVGINQFLRDSNVSPSSYIAMKQGKLREYSVFYKLCNYFSIPLDVLIGADEEFQKYLKSKSSSKKLAFSDRSEVGSPTEAQELADKLAENARGMVAEIKQQLVEGRDYVALNPEQAAALFEALRPAGSNKSGKVVNPRVFEKIPVMFLRQESSAGIEQAYFKYIEDAEALLATDATLPADGLAVLLVLRMTNEEFEALSADARQENWQSLSARLPRHDVYHEFDHIRYLHPALKEAMKPLARRMREKGYNTDDLSNVLLPMTWGVLDEWTERGLPNFYRQKKSGIDGDELRAFHAADREFLFTEAPQPDTDSRDGPDRAEVTEGKTNSKDLGGIDLNARMLQLGTEGSVVEFTPQNRLPIDPHTIEGFTPVIIYITPVVNLPLLLGINERNDEHAPVNSPVEYSRQPEAIISRDSKISQLNYN